MQEGQDKLPTIEEVKKQLQGLSEINDPKGQVDYLKALEKDLRSAFIARLGRQGDSKGSRRRLAALKRFVRRKEKAEAWQKQHLARKARGQIELTGPAFTAPSGSEELQSHLRKVRHHNKMLRRQAEGHWLQRYNRDLGVTGYDPDEVEGRLRGIESSIKDCQERVLSLIEDYAGALETPEERKSYLKRMLLWYDEADRLCQHHYGGVRPFRGVREGVKVLLDASNVPSTQSKEERTVKIRDALQRLAADYGSIEEFGGDRGCFFTWAGKEIDSSGATAQRAVKGTKCFIPAGKGKRGRNLVPMLRKVMDYSGANGGGKEIQHP